MSGHFGLGDRCPLLVCTMGRKDGKILVRYLWERRQLFSLRAIVSLRFGRSVTIFTITAPFTNVVPKKKPRPPDRKSTRLNYSHITRSRMPSSA